MSILVNVVNQKMYVSSTMDGIVAGSQKFVRFRFNFNEDWDGLTIFAQFQQNGTAYNQYLDEDSSVYLPAEIDVGTCTLMLYGTKDKVIGTTNYLTFKIDENIVITDASSTEISEPLYNQLVSKVDELTLEMNEFVNSDEIYNQIDEAVKAELKEYYDSGKITNLAIEIDKNFNPESENAQSGIGVAQALSQAAPTIKQTAKGEMINVENVSPIEHNLKVKVTSGTVEDLTSVTVIKHGKNLFPLKIDDILLNTNFNTNGSFNNFEAGLSYFIANYFIPVMPNTTYVFSWNIQDFSVRAGRICYYDKNQNLINCDFINYLDDTFTTPENCYYIKKAFDLKKQREITKEDLNGLEIQLELGNETTEYEPYKDVQVTTANVDGTVEGLTSVSPKMFIYADKNVTLECEYNVDAKSYIDKKLSDIAIKQVADGKAIVINDVSPMEHKLKVKVTSDTVEDLTTAKVYRYGKNLADLSVGVNDCLTNNGDGSYTITRLDGKRFSGEMPIHIPKDSSVMISATIIDNKSDQNVLIQFNHIGGATSSRHIETKNDAVKYENRYGADVKSFSFFYNDEVPIGQYLTFKDFQIELGDTKTEYEPFNGQTATANADGTVDGLTSVSPNMVLFSNTDVTLECEYNVDTKTYVDDTFKVDETYSPDSALPQSGKAVAQAIEPFKNKILDFIEYDMFGVGGDILAITNCKTSISGNHVIPNLIDGYLVMGIMDDAFTGCERLESIVIPDSVKTIGNYAFNGCTNLTDIIIGNSVESIGEYAFSYCYNLRSITIPNSVTSIGARAFFECGTLTNITIPNNVETLYLSAFDGCTKLKDIRIPASTTIIDDTETTIDEGISTYALPRNTTQENGLVIYYEGTEEQWNDLGIQGEIFSNATILFNQSVKALSEKLEESVPIKVSQLENDSGYLTDYTETDPTVPNWAKQPSKPTYTANEVGADPTGTADNKVSAHNTDTDSHNDIRLELKSLADKLNAFLDSDDTTLDELSELITAIQNNQGTIEQLTSNKVNVTDIINNLTTNTTNKPLSAAQGVALKALVDAIVVPTKVSELDNDEGYLKTFTETDPTVPSHVKSITTTDISKWNNKSEFSGNYNDLTNKPTIPTVPTDISAFNNDKGYLTEHQDISNLATKDELNGKANTSHTHIASEVGAEPVGTASGEVSAHNTNTSAHNDIRLLIQGLTTRLNALANSTDEDLDQMAEIVAYIKANKELIDSITTSKVSVADIIDNLTTSVSNKPLSAKQGVVLKGLIDSLSTGKLDTSALTSAINTALSQAKASGEFDGTDGTSVTVSNVSESTVSGGTNTVTFSDGKTVNIKNGTNGKNGATPTKGIDYWTDADKEQIVQEVIIALGTPVFGRIDTENNIILTGVLADGTYNIKYEDAEGNTTDIGSISFEKYTNMLLKAISSDGTPYNNGQGWKTGYRLNSSGTEAELSGMEVTGFIPVNYGDIVYMRNVGWKPNQGNAQQTYLWCYDTNKNVIAYGLASGINANNLILDGNGNLIQFTANNTVFYTTKQGNITNMAYIRLNCEDISNNSIITVNQPIE